MRVRLFHTIASEGRTSMEVYGSELAQALERLGDGVSVADWYPDEPNLGGGMAGNGAVRRVAGYVSHYAVYPWRVRGQGADVNHILDHGYSQLMLSLDGRRTVVTFHDAFIGRLRAHELPTRFYPRLTILGYLLNLWLLKRAARVIVPSESSKGDLVRFAGYSPDRIRVIPQGVSERFRAPEALAGRCPKPDRARILHVGHCGIYKNIETILRAVPLISRRLGSAVVFTKVGGSFTSSQRALINRLGIGEQVEYLGMVPLADLPATYAGADVLLMPSLYEGFGLPVLEAMACGTPVVASNEGSLPEVVGDAGLLVEPTAVGGIADAVARVLTNSTLRADLQRRGLERARTFSWERTARETLAVYREVDAGQSRAGG